MCPVPHVRKPTPVQGDTCSVITNGDLQSRRKKRMVAAHPVQEFEAFLPDPWWEFEPVQRFVCRVDKGLGVAPMEGTNHIPFIATREYCLDAFVRSKYVFDQTFTGCNIDIEVEGGRAPAFNPGGQSASCKRGRYVRATYRSRPPRNLSQSWGSKSDRW